MTGEEREETKNRRMNKWECVTKREGGKLEEREEPRSKEREKRGWIFWQYKKSR